MPFKTAGVVQISTITNAIRLNEPIVAAVKDKTTLSNKRKNNNANP